MNVGVLKGLTINVTIALRDAQSGGIVFQGAQPAQEEDFPALGGRHMGDNLG